MLVLRSVIYDALIYGMLVVMGIVLLPLTVTRDGAHWVVKLYTRAALWLARVICGIRIEVRGAVPAGDVLVCSKHHSFLDILMLVEHLPRAKFVMKRELRYVPILGLYAMRIGSTPVARGRRSQAMKEMVAHAESRATASGQLVVYPQGTRVEPGAHLPYKIGAGVLYDRLGLPAVLVATNAGVFWGRRKWVKRPGTAVIEFLETVPAGLEIKEFIARIEPVIEVASDQLIREAGFDLPAARATA